MRTYSVVVTETAERDLVGIVDYLLASLLNASAAAKIVDEFEQLVESLEKLPHAHAAVRDGILSLAGYRWSAVGSYMVFFTVDDDLAVVNIERVLHGSMNWRNIV